MLSLYNSAHVSLCNYFSFIVSLFAHYVVLFHVRNKDKNNKKRLFQKYRTTLTSVYIFFHKIFLPFSTPNIAEQNRVAICSDDLTFAYKSKISAIHCVNSVNETVSYYINKLGKS